MGLKSVGHSAHSPLTNTQTRRLTRPDPPALSQNARPVVVENSATSHCPSRPTIALPCPAASARMSACPSACCLPSRQHPTHTTSTMRRCRHPAFTIYLLALAAHLSLVAHLSHYPNSPRTPRSTPSTRRHVPPLIILPHTQPRTRSAPGPLCRHQQSLFGPKDHRSLAGTHGRPVRFRTPPGTSGPATPVRSLAPRTHRRSAPGARQELALNCPLPGLHRPAPPPPSGSPRPHTRSLPAQVLAGRCPAPSPHPSSTRRFMGISL